MSSEIRDYGHFRNAPRRSTAFRPCFNALDMFFNLSFILGMPLQLRLLGYCCSEEVPGCAACGRHCSPKQLVTLLSSHHVPSV
jgi:hypothetical protein